MSFKYRFIVSFVLLEIIFITLIVTMNFVAINNSSNKLIEDKIQSTMSFIYELAKIPISIYDIATLDDLVIKVQNSDSINSVIVLDNQNRVLSKSFNFAPMNIDELISKKNDFSFEYDDETYEIRYSKIIEEDTFLGSLYIVFDTSENKQFISNNTKNTLMIIAIEILISTILSYIIGSKLTIMLTDLAETAKQIGENKHPEIPYLDKKNEIGILSNSMNQMQVDLKTRNNRLKELALQLNNQKNELIEAHKEKDDFLANMSHELKTPLNSINVISSVMMKNKKGKLDLEQVKNLEIINHCGKDLLFLINDILDISKLEAGQIELNNFTIDVYDLIMDVSQMFKPQVEEKGLEFICECERNIGFIFSDENRIKQIVKNLLSNALKFTSKGEIKLKVNVNNDFLEILVIDQGIGIAQNKLEHIFDRFKQADSSTTRKFGGTGLGLAISKELAKLMGGDIEVKSKIDKGSIFKVSILRNEKEVKSMNKRNDDETLLKKEEAFKNIILLNDDPVSFLTLVVELKKISKVTQVMNIDELFKKLEQDVFDFLIVDNAAIKGSCLDNLHFKELILVAYDDKIDENTRKKAKYIVHKPFNKDEITNIIKEKS